jgi:uncharacterized protein (DUF2141 family)
MGQAMASNIDSFINLRSTGTSGSLTHYADGRFLSVWTDFDKDGGAYVYGKLFNADGTAAGNHFLIDYAVETFYREIRAETLTDGRTVVAWVKSDSSGASVVGRVLNTNFVPSSELLTFSPNAESEEALELHAMEGGSFAVLYRGSGTFPSGPFTGLIGNSLSPDGTGWKSEFHDGLSNLPNDGTNRTVILADGTCVIAVAVPAEDGDGTNIGVLVPGPTGEFVPVFIDFIPGVLTGVNPAIASYDSDSFIVARDNGAGQNSGVIKAQVFQKTGQPLGNTFTFEKPAGTLKGNPVIEKFANGGFAIAFVTETNGDENVYTAAVKPDGTVTDTIQVGTNTAGDQWDPSITELSGGTYAVSWLSNGESGPSYQYIVEVIGREGTDVVTPITPGGVGEPPPPPPPPPPPGSVWAGTNGNDIHTGTSASEVLKGLGGRDMIEGGAGNDKLWGGLGNDSLMGGDGLDIFVFDTKPSKSSNRDMIADYRVADDSIWLENKVFTKLGKKGSEASPAKMSKSFFASEKAKDKNDYIIYSKKKGTISYDADGSGTKYKAIEFATVKKGLKLTHDDFFVI